MRFIEPHWPVLPHVKAFTTQREGGFSQSPYASFNLADHIGDDNAAQNRTFLREKLQLPTEPVWLKQVHGTKVIQADQASLNEEADASQTRKTRLICAVLTADCLPILVSDRKGTQVAAIHAGWRGLVAGVIEQTLSTFTASPNEILVWLGPAIGPQAFEVGAEVREQFLNADPESAVAFNESIPDHWLADIYLLAKQCFARLGVTNIFGGEHCTYTESDKFYSYRRDQKQTGRMASLIWLDK